MRGKSFRFDEDHNHIQKAVAVLCRGGLQMIDELLARLEPTACKFDIGRGGIPQLTPQDIAAALGLCEDKFAVAIYQAVVGGSFDWPSVDKVIASAQFEEWRNRADRMVNAQLAKAAAGLAPRAERAERSGHADMLLAGARAAMWPQLVESVYSAMRRALVAELRASRICPTCNGRLSVLVDNRMIECETCLATGRVAISNRQRAAALGVIPSSYERTWRPVYEWMYRMLSNAVERGRRQFSDALGRVAQ
jgi:hypothetical protein